MHYHRIIYLLFGFLWPVQDGWSQPLDTRMYTTLDGLSDNGIYSMYEDRLGYIWFGTILGLDRFDGTNFKHYGIVNGLPNLACNVMFEDRTGRFWVGTRNGIAEFRKDSFYVYGTSDNVQLTYIMMFYEDPQKELIANTPQGQYRFNGQQWEPYCVIQTQDNDIIASTVQTNEGEYFSTGFEIFFRNNQGKIRSIWRHAADSPFFRGLQLCGNKVILNANFTIYEIDSAHATILFPNELKGKSISSLFMDSQKRWWFSTRKEGIHLLEQRDGHTQVRTIPFVDNISLFYEDRAQQMWITTSQGVMKVLPQQYSSMIINEIKGIHHILNLIPVGGQEILISVNNGQLLHIQYDITDSPAYQLKAIHFLDIPIDFVDHYSFGPQGELWLVTRMAQLYLLKNGVLLNKTSLVTNAGQQYAFGVVCDQATNQIIVALDSILAIGNEDQLDTLFDHQNAFIQFPRQLTIKKDNQLVVKTPDGEIYFYQLHDGTANRFIKMDIPPSPGRAIKLDQKQNLWIINRGQNMIRYSDGVPPEMKMEEVIDEVSDNITSFSSQNTFDQDQNIWCINNRGIEYLYRDKLQQWQSQQHIVYEISHAAYSDWYKIVESGSKILVSLKNQLIFFDRTVPEHPKTPGKVILEDVHLHNQSIQWLDYTDSVYSYFEIPARLTLKHHQNTLTFNYNCPTTLENQNTTYAYRLLPLDAAWSKPSQNRSVSFSQLKPANYIFQVRGRNKGTVWSEPALFAFTIQKPFWDTTWFRIMILLLAAGFVTWIFRIRLKQERAKGEIKSQLLELEMRALRAQMNPHFIYNALNSIQSLVATNQTASANKYISKFARLLRQVLENSRRSEITLKQELDSLRLYVDLEQLRLDSQIVFLETLDEDINPETILVPPLILQPFVENALWHGLSSKEGEKRIELSVKQVDTCIEFEIRDNGIGRKQASTRKSLNEEHESTAIQVTAQRLQDFNGPSQIHPLVIDDLYDPDGTAVGTRILLKVKKKMPVRQPVQ